MSVTMRFDGVELCCDPKTLKIERNRKINCDMTINGGQIFKTACEGISRIKGTGELYGNECFLNYEKLLKMYILKTPKTLSLPHLGAFYAAAEDISVLAEPKDSFLSISFDFRVIENENRSAKITPEKYTTVWSNESLWDVSYRCGIPIETLILLNPQIRFIMFPAVGERVKLR